MTIGFNLSAWALQHRALVWFAMIIVIAAGLLSYFRLGRNEDPPFTIKTMIVQVGWPGATATEMLDEVTDRVEEKLQEIPYLDYVRSYTVPGQTTIFVNLLGSTPAAAVPDAWYQVHKKIGGIVRTLPQGIVGPFFDDEFGDTYGIIYAFTADGFTERELRDYAKEIRSQLLAVPDVSKIDIFGAQDEKIYLEFSPQKMAGLHLSRQDLIAALQAQNAVTPAGVVQTRDEKIQIQVSGGFASESPMDGCFALVTSVRSSAVTRTRRNRRFASMASPRSASASRCARGAMRWRSALASIKRWRRLLRICRSASSHTSSPTSRGS
jgi:multidrug efflux pump